MTKYRRSKASQKRAKQRSKRNLRMTLDGRNGPVSTREAGAEDLARFEASSTSRTKDDATTPRRVVDESAIEVTASETPREKAARDAQAPPRSGKSRRRSASSDVQPRLYGRNNLSESAAREVGQTVNPRRLKSEGFTARYTTECVSCGETIWKGRAIVRSRSEKRPGWKHANCKQPHM